jgi:hypothetical protein
MISLCLQTCPHDYIQACELALLICDIQKVHPAPGAELFLIYRKDTPLQVPKYFNGIAKPVFDRAEARSARNHDVGWPGGSNMLAASSFIEMTLLLREGVCKNEAFLLFEPDCIPLTLDWLERLAREWETVKAKGKQAFGHWHQQGDLTTLHMNGNAVFRTDFFDQHPTWIVGPSSQGWDYWFRGNFIPISCDSNLIFQHYNRHGLTLEEFQSIEKNGVRPALFHGVKTDDGRRIARSALLEAKEPAPASAPEPP